jgi:hypothetical protein
VIDFYVACVLEIDMYSWESLALVTVNVLFMNFMNSE